MGSFKKRLYYALLMFLMCTAALTLFLLIWSLDTRAKVSAFAREGMVAQGVVLDKVWSYKASTASHNVQVRFVDLDGVERTSWIQIHPLIVSVSAGRSGSHICVQNPSRFIYRMTRRPWGERRGLSMDAIGCGVIAVILSVANLVVFRPLDSV